MERQKSGEKALKFFLLLLLAAGAVVAVLPYGAAASWRQIFSFFGLRDFSAAADGSPMAVHVLNVGKADSIFVECEGKAMLVDGGTADCGEQIAEYLGRRGIKKLDAVVNTHPDGDHIGGLSAVLGRFPTDRYFAPAIPEKLVPFTEEYRDVQSVLALKHRKAETPHRGESFSLGNCAVRVLAPVRPGNSTNNNSIVLLLTYGGTRFLLMGDAEREEEADLLAAGGELSVDVLKVGHHGSSTSTTEALLRAVGPRYAAVSVADDTSHLPKDDVLKRLAESGARIYRTDVSGTLIFLSDGKTVSVVTERGKS